VVGGAPLRQDVGMGTGAARFKELSLDTSGSGEEAGRFWAAATGCDYVSAGDPDYAGDVVGAEEGMGIAICPVPEPKTAKNRVHLDLHTDSVETLVALGATVLPEQNDEDRWTVLADPEGNELCAFVRGPDEVPAYKVYEMVVDSVDPEAIGRWWADVFGVQLQHQDGKPWTWLEDVPGLTMGAWVFNPVPEPKTVKNRLHWDVYGDVADFEARGAARLWAMPRWTVLADPEGNEFCVFPVPDGTDDRG
jgi:hypothetical protein